MPIDPIEFGALRFNKGDTVEMDPKADGQADAIEAFSLAVVSELSRLSGIESGDQGVPGAAGLSVATIQQLENLTDLNPGDPVNLTDPVRYGTFIARAGDYSAEIASDPEQGKYVAGVGGVTLVRSSEIPQVRHFGAGPNDLAIDSVDAWEACAQFAGEGGVWAVAPGAYRFLRPFETQHNRQRIINHGAVIDGTMVNLHIGTQFAAPILFDGHLSEDGSGPWRCFINHRGGGSDIRVSAEHIAGVALINGGLFRSQVAESEVLSVRAEFCSLAGAECVERGALQSYVERKRRSIANGGTVANDIYTLGTITAGGSGYRDGRWVTRARTLSGPGRDAILGVRVEGGTVVECVVLGGGIAYAPDGGSTLTMGLPADTRANETVTGTTDTVARSRVYQSMYPQYDERRVEMRVALMAAVVDERGLDITDADFLAAKAERDALAEDEIGSGFVYTTGSVCDHVSWVNSNLNMNVVAKLCSFGGYYGVGRSNYDVISFYAEAVDSGRYPMVEYAGVSVVVPVLNCLVNAQFQDWRDGVPVVSFDGCNGLIVSGGRSGNPFVVSEGRPNWAREIVERGNDTAFFALDVFCQDNHTRGRVVAETTELESLTFTADPTRVIRSFAEFATQADIDAIVQMLDSSNPNYDTVGERVAALVDIINRLTAAESPDIAAVEGLQSALGARPTLAVADGRYATKAAATNAQAAASAAQSDATDALNGLATRITESAADARYADIATESTASSALAGLNNRPTFAAADARYAEVGTEQIASDAGTKAEQALAASPTITTFTPTIALNDNSTITPNYSYQYGRSARAGNRVDFCLHLVAAPTYDGENTRRFVIAGLPAAPGGSVNVHVGVPRLVGPDLSGAAIQLGAQISPAGEITLVHYRDAGAGPIQLRTKEIASGTALDIVIAGTYFITPA